MRTFREQLGGRQPESPYGIGTSIFGHWNSFYISGRTNHLRLLNYLHSGSQIVQGSDQE